MVHLTELTSQRIAELHAVATELREHPSDRMTQRRDAGSTRPSIRRRIGRAIIALGAEIAGTPAVAGSR